MSMKHPPHPGLVVLQECIEPLGLSLTDAATALGVTRNTLSELANGAFHRKWPSVSQGSLAVQTKVGWRNSHNMNLPMFDAIALN